MKSKRASRLFRLGRDLAIILFVLAVAGESPRAFSQEKIIRILPPDEKKIQVRDLSSLPHAQIPDVPAPATVSEPKWDQSIVPMTLDEAIRIDLANSAVVRILAGTTAIASGATIYDPAITHTGIDAAKGRFDPTVNLNNTFSRTNPPIAALDPLDPRRAFFEGVAVDAYNMNLGVSKINSFGGTTNLGVSVTPSSSPTNPLLAPLNPQTASKVELSYTQPLLQGGGLRANLAPIVIARLNTEKSYFQFKDSLQQSVQGVVQAYWGVVFARTDVWARRQQVGQLEEAMRRAEAQMRLGRANIGEVAQARSALATFKATLIASESNQLNQEALLANILGLPPTTHYIPRSPPSAVRIEVVWDEILRLAEEHRPDLIELKLIIEADQQMIYMARNQARPKLDATALYRWNGLEGTLPGGTEVSTKAGQFGEWNLGINFSVPLSLRTGRANLRQQELIMVRDKANLDQGIHSATQTLALHVRNLAQDYEQYLAFRDARVAARLNLDLQLENYRNGRTILLNVLQAITDWGNAVSAESQSLTQYNTELASLEQQTGTILETHGIRFFEERYRSIGPLGQLGHCRPYPEDLHPTPNADRYPTSPRPAEEFFDLQDPLRPKPLPPADK